MKKKVIVIMIVALIVIISATIILVKIKENNVPEKDAFYIGDGSTQNDYWLRYRKTFYIENKQDTQNVFAEIVADTKYWLYINGKIVVREGSLKRSQAPDSVYADTVELSPYLQEGENTIAVLVWYWGKLSYSHYPLNQRGLYFKANIGNDTLISDNTWKVSKYSAYFEDDAVINPRLAEYNVAFDARKSEDNWYLPEFDDSSWANSTEYEDRGCPKIERDIPFFKDYELKEYENIKDYANYTTKTNETLIMKIPYNAQFTPYLEIEAPEGKEIIIYTDTYITDAATSLRAKYITKNGVQKYESLGWLNGEKVYYEIPEGVRIISLKYRETGYNTELSGNFECNDEFLNTLWKKAQRTLYVNMRDTYMDCPNRERAQWALDMGLEMEQAMYALDTNAYSLYKHGVRSILGWNNENALLTVVPNSLDPIQLPVQNLLLIDTFYKYYEYTGDIEFLNEIYPYVREYLNLWQKNQFGVLQYTSYYNIWEWKDMSEDMNYKHLECISYYLAKQSASKMANVLNLPKDASDYNKDLKDLEKMYLDFAKEDEDVRINALAVVSGLVKKDDYEKVSQLFKEDYSASPAMEKYVLEALCIMGKQDIAIERMKTKYYDMVSGKDAVSTLWEHWESESGSKNHAWAGGPIVILSKYFAGISPLNAGYETISVKPKMTNLDSIKTNVTTIKGDINLNISKSKSTFTMNLNVPAKTIVGIPLEYEDYSISINDKEVYTNKKAKFNFTYKYLNKDEEFLYFKIPEGNYIIDCKIK